MAPPSSSLIGRSPVCAFVQLPAASVLQELQEEVQQARREAQRHQDGQGCAEQELQEQRGRLAAAQAEVLALREAQEELQEADARLREKVARLEVTHCPRPKPGVETSLFSFFFVSRCLTRRVMYPRGFKIGLP